MKDLLCYSKKVDILYVCVGFNQNHKLQKCEPKLLCLGLLKQDMKTFTTTKKARNSHFPRTLQYG